MPEIDAEMMVDQVRMLGLVSQDQLREATADAEDAAPDTILRHLLRKGALTSWQIDRLKNAVEHRATEDLKNEMLSAASSLGSLSDICVVIASSRRDNSRAGPVDRFLTSTWNDPAGSSSAGGTTGNKLISVVAVRPRRNWALAWVPARTNNATTVTRREVLMRAIIRQDFGIGSPEKSGRPVRVWVLERSE